jgi:carbonic anhydrase/acetyltransferase-like protein (isoleucine patch superfamily)
MFCTMRRLTQKEIAQLERSGCSAESWAGISVSEGFTAERVRNTAFFGEVELGNNEGWVLLDGLKRPCGIGNATIANCRIGRDVYIAAIGSAIVNYDIEDGAVVEDVSGLVTEPGASFGNGFEIRVMNERGGRSVTLYDELNAQIAYVQAFFRNDTRFQEELSRMIAEYVEKRRADRGRISKEALIRGCGFLKNVNVGPSAVVQGALRLENGTILSCAEHPSSVGAGVTMSDFIMSEGASVDSGAMVHGSFVGQGTQVGKQCSVENSLLFANSEAFHTEICSVFGGPYTVTHHKSTLLIASLWSFYNAGSGTNQSNHMYKLGPVHQGVFERGCKTGSFAYNMMACHVAPFTVIIGKHMANIDIPDFPFSYLTEEDGRSNIIMGMNIFSVGTLRDSEKWPARDRREAPVKRDSIVFDVFSPYTVEKLRRGRAIMQDLYETTPREESVIHYRGVWIKRLLLKKGVRYYTLAIDRYLLGHYFRRIDESLRKGESWTKLSKGCRAKRGLPRPERWTDIGGLLISWDRLQDILEKIRRKGLEGLKDLAGCFEEALRGYRDDEWDYVCHAFEQEYGTSPAEVGPEALEDLAERWATAANALVTLTLENTKSEYAVNAMIGYGLGGEEQDVLADFIAVRGIYDEDPSVLGLQEERDRIDQQLRSIRAHVKKYL